MLDKSFLASLQDILGKEGVLADKAGLVAYSYDATADVPRPLPDVVVLPSSAEQVERIVRLALAHDVPIYPRGAGTNLSGGAIPLRAGIVLSMQRMNRIVEVDPANLTATVEPGVVIQALNDAVARTD